MHIGLIGGIGPAAQDYYTRQLIGHFSHAGVGLDLTTAVLRSDTVAGGPDNGRHLKRFLNLFPE